MNNFTYLAPTKIYFGRDEEKNVGNILKEYNATKVLLIYGKSSIKKIGLYDTVVESLKNAKIDFVEISGVKPNPELKLVLEAVKLAKESNVDFILAVGGGSVIDTAKSVSHGILTDVNPWKYQTKELTPERSVKVGCILTISAAGSEMSNSCVITNEETLEKRGFNSEANRPAFAILNPELTYSVSKYQTACGITDIMMHTLERYFANTFDTELTDNLALGLLKAVKDAGLRAINDPKDYNARADLMWASSLSHNNLTGLGKTFVMSVHQIEHEISGMYPEVAHGAGLAVIWPYWALECYKQKKSIDRFARLAYEVMGVEKNINLSDTEAALQGILKMQEYFKKLGMPTHLKELGVDESKLEELAYNYTFKGKRVIEDIITVDYDTCLSILKAAK